MIDAGSSLMSDYGITIISNKRLDCAGQEYRIIGGWQAVVRDLRLKAGDRVQLEPISRNPWRLRLTVLPTESGRLLPLNAEPLPRGSEAEVGAQGDSQSRSSAASEPASEEVSAVSTGGFLLPLPPLHPALLACSSTSFFDHKWAGPLSWE